MNIKNNDVKVLGRIVAITTDKTVASAEQVKDENYKGGMFQSDINQELKQSVDDIAPIEDIEIDNITKI